MLKTTKQAKFHKQQQSKTTHSADVSNAFHQRDHLVAMIDEIVSFNNINDKPGWFPPDFLVQRISLTNKLSQKDTNCGNVTNFNWFTNIWIIDSDRCCLMVRFVIGFVSCSCLNFWNYLQADACPIDNCISSLHTNPAQIISLFAALSTNTAFSQQHKVFETKHKSREYQLGRHSLFYNTDCYLSESGNFNQN